jgi:hypothetical protein
VIARSRIASAEVVESHSTFTQAIAMAGIAVVLEDRPDLPFESVVERLGGGRSQRNAQNGRNENHDAPRRGPTSAADGRAS